MMLFVDSYHTASIADDHHASAAEDDDMVKVNQALANQCSAHGVLLHVLVKYMMQLALQLKNFMLN